MKNTDTSDPSATSQKKPWKRFKEIGLRIKKEVDQDHIQVMSAGVAFYFFLALFPAIGALISIYGLVVDPVEVQQQMSQASGFLPDQAEGLLAGILDRIAAKSPTSLGWSFLFSILLSLWSANKGTSALFEGINAAYNELDNRGFLKKYMLTLGFTLLGILVGIISIAIVVGYPALIDDIALPAFLQRIIEFFRWILLGGIITGLLSMLYKFAPNRNQQEFKWFSAGAIIATVLWLLGSLLFSLYVDQFGNFDATYGSVAAVIILMLWFFLSAFVILLGAEINSQLEQKSFSGIESGE